MTIKDSFAEKWMQAFIVCPVLAALLLSIGISVSAKSDSNNPFAVSPCSDVYTSTPGNCPYMEPLAGAVYQTGPSIAYDAGHGMNLFVRDSNAYLEYASQSAPGATSWNPSLQLMWGNLNSDPVIITRKEGNFDVFYIGLDEALWEDKQSGGKWSGHLSIGGAAGGQVTTAYDPATDKVQLLYKGDDQSLMTITENGSKWSKPACILPAGSITSNIAYIDSGGRRYLFYRAMDGSLKSVTIAPGFTAANAPVTLTRPQAVTSNIAPALDARGNIITFYRGPDYVLWEVPQAGNGWGHPSSLGGRVSSDLAVATLPGKQIRVYYRSADGGVNLVQQDQNSATGWGRHTHLMGLSANAKNTSGATLLSQTLYSNPVIGINPDGRQEVFFVGFDGALWHMWEMAASSSRQPYPAWSSQMPLDKEIAIAPRGNSIIALASTGARPVASYTVLDAATISDIMSNVQFFSACSPPVIGYNHTLPACGNIIPGVIPSGPVISRGMGIALLIDDIQTAINAVKAANTGAVTQAQFDALIKTQLTKMGILQ